MRAQLDIPDRLGAAAVDAALEGLVQLGEAEMREATVEGAPIPLVYESGARWGREHGTEHWLTPRQVLAATVEGRPTDCEDLAAYRAAELRHTGADPDARARVIRSSPNTWHAVVERGDGSIEDPSRVLGMGEPETSGIGLGDWAVDCSRVPGGWQCTLTRGGRGVVGQSRYAHDAMCRAAALGWATAESHRELGLDIPIPGLDIASRALSAALSAAVPGLIPPVPKAAPVVAPASRAAPTTAETSADLDTATRAIARRISAIATAEARRKIREARSIVSAGEARTKRAAALEKRKADRAAR